MSLVFATKKKERKKRKKRKLYHECLQKIVHKFGKIK